MQRIALFDVISTQSRYGLLIYVNPYFYNPPKSFAPSSDSGLYDLSISASSFHSNTRANLYIHTITSNYTVKVNGSTFSSSYAGVHLKSKSSTVDYKIDFQNSVLKGNGNHLVIDFQTSSWTLVVSNVSSTQALSNGIAVSHDYTCEEDKKPAQLLIERANVTNSGDTNVYFASPTCLYNLEIKDLYNAGAGFNGLHISTKTCARNKNRFQLPRITVTNTFTANSAYDNYHICPTNCNLTLLLEDAHRVGARSNGILVRVYCDNTSRQQNLANISVTNATWLSVDLTTSKFSHRFKVVLFWFELPT